MAGDAEVDFTEREYPEMENNRAFKAISRRRISSSLITQQLWDAINHIYNQRQQSNLERITKYMTRVHGVSEEEVRRQLIHCERDGLLKHFRRIGCKGKNLGLEQEGYQIPTELDPPRDGHDWYCFECHNSGDVICCTNCYRVYHLACLPPADLPTDDAKYAFLCTTCKTCIVGEDTWVVRKEINKLLIYTCQRLKERLPVRLTDRHVPSKSACFTGERSTIKGNITWVVDEEQLWRADFLLYRSMDITVMERKAQNVDYTCLAEFEADAATIVHNVVIYHGVNSLMADMVRQMFEDCLYDLAEIKQCFDCYRRSNEKTNEHWFCMPCNPPHTLVYAKQKGYPYWPAKVIKVSDKMYDVRFFGEPHERAKLEAQNIKPISANLAALGVKRTSAFNKAFDELRRHQRYLSQGPPPEGAALSDDEAEEDEAYQKKVKKNPTSSATQDSVYDFGETESMSEEPKPTNKGKKRKSYTSSTPKPNVKKPRKSSAGRKRKQELPGPSVLEVKVEAESFDYSSGGEESASSMSQQNMPAKEDEDLVSSSCTEPRTRSIALQTPPRLNKTSEAARAKKQQKLDTEAIEKLKHEWDREMQVTMSAVSKQHERELERVRAEYDAELVRISEKHRVAIAETKRKQWCYNCETEAIYHCCWNTAYCSTECQQSHWHKEHKRLCRRKR